MMTEGTNPSNYWNERYLKNQTGWDVGYPTPPIKAYIDHLVDKELAILIPGCGNSYEAKYLLDHGFNNITLIDIAPVLTASLREKFAGISKDRLRIITGDFFEHQGQYDLVLEQTFLSALPPGWRPRYADKMKELLKPGGRLAGVIFNRHFDESPPYGGSEEEYRALFGPRFIIETMAPCYNSIEARKGSELFIQLRADRDGT